MSETRRTFLTLAGASVGLLATGGGAQALGEEPGKPRGFERSWVATIVGLEGKELQVQVEETGKTHTLEPRDFGDWVHEVGDRVAVTQSSSGRLSVKPHVLPVDGPLPRPVEIGSVIQAGDHTARIGSESVRKEIESIRARSPRAVVQWLLVRERPDRKQPGLRSHRSPMISLGSELIAILGSTLLLLAATTKLGSPGRLREPLEAIGVPSSLAAILPIPLGLVELTAAGALVFERGLLTTSLVALLAALFLGAGLASLFKGLDVPCHCLGSGRGRLGWSQVAAFPFWLLVAGLPFVPGFTQASGLTRWLAFLVVISLVSGLLVYRLAPDRPFLPALCA